MKKIINGRKYDTETAKHIGTRYEGRPGSFEFFSEELYRKKTGEFFILGDGGPRSPYTRDDDGNIAGACCIVPYTEKQAKKWVEEYCSADTYEEIFGEVEE